MTEEVNTKLDKVIELLTESLRILRDGCLHIYNLVDSKKLAVNGDTQTTSTYKCEKCGQFKIITHYSYDDEDSCYIEWNGGNDHDLHEMWRCL